METHEPSLDRFHLESSIPVLRMLDEAKAKAFYVDFLGFTIDWEHRFRDSSPLYMQIRHGTPSFTSTGTPARALR